MSPSQKKAVEELRTAGYAVIIWAPEELRNADPEKVQDRSIEQGWVIIDCLQDDE